MDGLIFDFDGVVVDSEPIHLVAFREVLKTAGVELARKDYYRKYLGYDDRDCFRAAMSAAGKTVGEARLDDMIARKTRLVQATYARSVPALPGAVELIRSAARAGVPLAVCSGSLREEIELASGTIGVRERFQAIVSGMDVRRGKPDPEGYALALELLGRRAGRPLSPSRCAAVEDSPAGIEAAKKVGLKVLAVTNSYDASALRAADRVVESLEQVTLASLSEL